jgi:hypothetical protein
MILQSIWSHPVTEGHMQRDLDGCPNLKFCTVVSAWYWSSMNCIFQFYRCLKSMCIVLLGVTRYCVFVGLLFMQCVSSGWYKKCTTYARSNILLADSLLHLTFGMSIHFVLMCW